jgi:hypothetical protein
MQRVTGWSIPEENALISNDWSCSERQRLPAPLNPKRPGIVAMKYGWCRMNNLGHVVAKQYRQSVGTRTDPQLSNIEAGYVW